MLNAQERELFDVNQRLLQDVLNKLSGLPDGLRQTLADHLWASTPETVFDSNWNPAASSVSVQPKSANPQRITGAYTWCPTGQTGFLQLGRDLFPVPAGPFLLAPIAVVLEYSDTRTLTSGLPGSTSPSSGFMFCGLFSQQLPRWSQIT